MQLHNEAPLVCLHMQPVNNGKHSDKNLVALFGHDQDTSRLCTMACLWCMYFVHPHVYMCFLGMYT